MSSAAILPNQSLVDFAIQHLGDESGAWEVARLNGLNLTDSVAAGTVLRFPDTINKRFKAFLKAGGFIPASGTEPLEININFQPFLVASTPMAQAGQTLLDIAIQWLGDESAVWELARLNGLGITKRVQSGFRLKFPAVVNRAIAEFFLLGDYHPAAEVEEVLEGIDYWAIQFDFEVQ